MKNTALPSFPPVPRLPRRIPSRTAFSAVRLALAAAAACALCRSASATTVAGNPRVRHGYARGTVDMGCFESDGSAGTILYFR